MSTPVRDLENGSYPKGRACSPDLQGDDTASLWSVSGFGLVPVG